ncbi:4Fe-4S binding protein [Thermodesulfobacterium sp. TA1]|uniref:4Fe-4S binding protein n=1 Tax=Thermodesulfobacterium sp. TA1 TaxID=2234087 RepID=UPI001981EFF7|nr:4Fe-4S binding protein [Thermodesulfobacterium sp. TA1]
MLDAKEQLKDLGLSLVKDYGLHLFKLKGYLFKIEKALFSGNSISLKKPEKLNLLIRLLGLEANLPERVLLSETIKKLLRLFTDNNLLNQAGVFFPQEMFFQLKDQGLLPDGIEKEIAFTYDQIFSKKIEEATFNKQLMKLSLAYVFGVEIFRSCFQGLGLSFVEEDIEEEEKERFIEGIGCEDLMHTLGGTFRASLGPINENLKAGYLKGLVLFEGSFLEEPYVSLIKGLLKENIWVWYVKGDTKENGKKKAIFFEWMEEAGDRLREFLEAFGLPPVLGLRGQAEVFSIMSEMVSYGGLGKTFAELPLVVLNCSEKHLKGETPGLFIPAFLGLGVEVLGIGKEFLPFNLFSKGFTFFEGVSPIEPILEVILQKIEAKRKALGIEQPKPRVLFDMEMRRALSSSEHISFYQKVVLQSIRNRFPSKVSPLKIAELNRQRCITCFACLKVCPFSAIFIDHGLNSLLIDLQRCTGCGVCVGECPSEAITIKVV